MKALKTYIEQINDPIRQQMLNYLTVEIELDRNVFENFDLSNKCMYDGQYDLALFVCKKIMIEEKPYLCFYENELSEFKNIFFEKLEIMFDSSKNHYDSKVNYDKAEKKFKELKIFLNFKEHSYSNLKQNMKAIIHELDHAYRDWESYVNGEEFHLYDFAKPGTRYYKSTKWDNDFKNYYAKKLVYHLEEIEQSAYLSEIYNDIKDLKFKDYKQLVDLAEQHSEAYQLYNMLLASFSELVKNKKFANIRLDDFCKQYNEINNTNLSNKEIVQEVTDKLSDYVSLMNKLLLKIYDEKVNINESLNVMHRPNNEFNKILRFMLKSHKN